MKKPFLLLVLCFVLSNLPLFAEDSVGKWSKRYNVTAVTMDDGLPHNFVDDIIKDSQGFLWLATRGGGIARYDGYEFTVFDMGSSRYKLRSNFVCKLSEDDFQRIWSVSEIGIDVVDLHTMQVVQINDAQGEPLPIFDRPAHFVFRSKAGNIWLCSENNLYKVTFTKQGDVQQLVKICEAPQGKCISTICEVDGYLWINYNEGVYRIKEATMQAQEPLFISSALQLPGVTIQTIRRKENEIWIGSAQGLFRYNMDTQLMKHYMHVPNDEGSLSQNYVTDIAETGERTMLVATLKGINLYNALTDNFERINNDADDEGAVQNTLNCDFVNCLCADGDIIWVGTEIGGLNKMSRRMLFVQNDYHMPSVSGSLSRNPVNAIYEDESGALWVGTVEGGLNRRAPGSQLFEHYTTQSPAFLSHNTVCCFTSDDKGRLWMGTWGGGIGWVDKQNVQQKKFHHIIVPGFDDFSWGWTGCICYDRLNDVIWTGTSTNVYVYDLKTQTVTEPFKGLDMGGIEGCTGCYIDKENNLWIGMTQGLCRVELKSLRSPKLDYRLWSSKLDEPASKLKERVTYITQTKDSTIWIGSNGYGFYKSHRDEQGEFSFRAYTTDDGLVSNSVRGISEDNVGHLWLTTTNGLSCFNPTNGNFVNYTWKDGLLSNHFYWNAIGRSAKGDLLYVGSTKGLSMVKPVIETNPEEIVRLALTHVRVADEERLCANGHLKLHERDKLLYIEFVALDYDAPTFAHYYYRLKGFDDKWVKVSAHRRQAAYTNLHPGNYTFEVRYAPDGETCLEEMAELNIEVTPYFYKTIWFVLAMLILVSYLLYEVLSWRMGALKQQRELLHQKVEERTRELEEQKKLLSTQASELYRQNQLLEQQHEKIAEQKNQLIEMSKNALLAESNSNDKRFLEKAMKIVEANYKNADYGVSDFIEEMGISKSLMNKKMQTLTGQPAGQFIRSYRLNVAKELIEENSVSHKLNISEIAYEVGFNDPKYFTRCFTKHFGTTPSALLEQGLAENP